jgi:hypothetical protein
MRGFVAIGLLMASCVTAAAQKSDFEGKPAPCFEVTMAPRAGGGAGFSTDPAFSILLNRCTGDTWMLVRTTISKGKGTAGEFAYRWYPVSVGSGEATLANPAFPSSQ